MRFKIPQKLEMHSVVSFSSFCLSPYTKLFNGWMKLQQSFTLLLAIKIFNMLFFIA